MICTSGTPRILDHTITLRSFTCAFVYVFYHESLSPFPIYPLFRLSTLCLFNPVSIKCFPELLDGLTLLWSQYPFRKVSLRAYVSRFRPSSHRTTQVPQLSSDHPAPFRVITVQDPSPLPPNVPVQSIENIRCQYPDRK